MLSRIFLLLGIVHFGYGQFINLPWGDLDNSLNPWFLNNNNNNNFGAFGLGLGIRQHHGKCTSTVNSQTQDGNCLTRPECSLSGGQVSGRNGCAFGVCCVYSRGCSQSSNKRVSYFESTTTNNVNTCQYVVQVENNNICQMRLDFENFNFPKPSRLPDPNNVLGTGPYLCRNGYMQVNSPNNGRIPNICGNMNAQHIYVPVNASLGQRQLVLDIVNAQNNIGGQNGNNVNTLNWRIKVTQLECPTLTKHQQKSLRVWEDSLMIAPDGCLQYHTESTGRIRSLGYDESGTAVGANFYQANLNYAICFKRSQDACGVSFNVEQFSLPGMRAGANTDCTNQGMDTDFLYVINGRITDANTNPAPTPNPSNQDRYCGPIVVNSNIQESTPGPLYIFFRTDNAAVDIPPATPGGPSTAPTENGWVMTYNILRGNNC